VSRILSQNCQVLLIYCNVGRWLGVRHLQFFLLFLSVVVAYGIRTNMSVGIIAMMETDPPDPSIPVSLVASLDPTHHHF
jgi:hypothetical protein